MIRNTLIKVGDRVRDIDPTWERFQQVGTCIAIDGNKILWKSFTDGQIIEDLLINMRRVR